MDFLLLCASGKTVVFRSKQCCSGPESTRCVSVMFQDQGSGICIWAEASLTKVLGLMIGVES